MPDSEDGGRQVPTLEFRGGKLIGRRARRKNPIICATCGQPIAPEMAFRSNENLHAVCASDNGMTVAQRAAAAGRYIAPGLVRFPGPDDNWQQAAGLRSHWLILSRQGTQSLINCTSHGDLPIVAQLWLGNTPRYYYPASIRVAPVLTTGDLTGNGKALLATLLDVYPGAQISFGVDDASEE